MASIHPFPQAFNEQETAALFQKYLPVRVLPEEVENRLLILVSRTVHKEFATISQPVGAWLRSFFLFPHQPFRTALVVLTSILFFMFGGNALRPDEQSTTTALVQPTNNGVTILRKNQTKAFAITKGDTIEIYVGDRLGTEESTVDVYLFPGQQIELAANTLVELRRLDENADKTVVELFVEHGLVHNEVESEVEKQVEYRIVSQAATVTVNGTVFDVDVESPTNAIVSAFTGEVAVESNGQSIILTSGQKVQAIIGRPLIIEPLQQPKTLERTTITPISTATQTSIDAAVCSHLLVDGDFEQHKTWVLPVSGSVASYEDDIVYQGKTSLRLGLSDSFANMVGYSSVYQALQLPDSINRITLQLMAWQRVDSSSLDRDTAICLVDSRRWYSGSSVAGC